jgi:type I restriction enzyme S subunit
VPWFKTGELFDSFLLQPTEHITELAVSTGRVKLLPRHAVLMAIYAAPTVGRLGVLTQDAAFNQACTGMIANPEVGPWFLFQTLIHGRVWFNSRANGAAQQNISKAIVENYPCIRPDDGVLLQFGTLCSAIYAAIENNSFSASALEAMRDSLLPRLISGKLRLPEAEEAFATF